MLIFKLSEDIQSYLTRLKHSGSSIGFIPTLGALHEGHLSLVHEARKKTGVVVCSIFVNPAQFNNPEDLKLYPRTIDQDIAVLEGAGCDILFIPEEREMYPEGLREEPAKYDLGSVEDVLEGKFRPNHFQGVARIIDKLLRIIHPDHLFLGLKDFQQCIVIEKLIAQMGHEVIVNKVATKREADGLAMSSRNRRMTSSQRSLAGLIYQCLVSVQAKQDERNFPVVQKECMELLHAKGFSCDYIVLADAGTLELLSNYDKSRPMVVLIAASIGDIRLIDNLLL